MENICVIGAGSFGSAIASHLAKIGNTVYLVGKNKAILDEIKLLHTNRKYLKDTELSSFIIPISEDDKVLASCNIIVFAVPSQAFSSAYMNLYGYISDDAIIVNLAKGIDLVQFKRLSEVAEAINPKVKYVALSGPSHAEEVAKDLPTTLVSASTDISIAKRVQDVFSKNMLRVYTNQDLIGVELAGAVKNIIALAAGIIDGLDFGDNAKAALITRGLAEMSRFGMKLGAKELTFSGLAGIGDLIVTCTSQHSRNRRCGYLIGRGYTVSEAIDEVNMVVEGITACKAVIKMNEELGVPMPITNLIYDVITNDVDIKLAFLSLLERELKAEDFKYD